MHVTEFGQGEREGGLDVCFPFSFAHQAPISIAYSDGHIIMSAL